MHFILWRYEVAPGARDEFEREYGPDGSWVALFREADGFVRTELHRDKSESVYRTVDVWDSEAAFTKFHSDRGDRYLELDRRMEQLTAREERIGTFTFRAARREDAPALAELMRRTFVDTYAAHNRPEDIAAYIAKSYGLEQQTRELDDPDTSFVVCECEGDLIAFAQLRRNASPAVDDPGAIELFRFYVDRGWHGRGVARLLMSEVSTAADAMRAGAVWLGVWEHNPRARAFYLKCGFRDVGWQHFTVGSDVQNDHVMLSALPIRV